MSERASIVAGVVLLGALSGVLAKMADQTEVSWLSALGTYPAIWMLVIVVISIRASSPALAAGVATVFFLALTVGYYTYAHRVLGFGTARDEVIWLVASVTIAPVTAAAFNWARSTPHMVAAVIPALFAAVILSSGSVRQYLLFLQGSLPEQVARPTVQAVVDTAVALAIVGFVPQSWRSRRLALILTIPAVLIAPSIIQIANNIAYS